MPKERNYNPVQAQRKADKAKAVKKGKADVQSRRNEQLARKNPDRIQKQIDDLKAVGASGGKLTKHEEAVLDGLEKELKAVKKAREALGDKAPALRSGGWQDRRREDAGHDQGRVLGKRRRGGEDGSSDEDEDDNVPEDVRRIPMPRDTPPPIPKEVMDAWYAKRRAKRAAENPGAGKEKGGEESRGKTAAAAPVVAQTVYEAKPVVRDLKKEATAAFVPMSVKMKMDKGKGQGGLMEPEEADRLEKEGYLKMKGEGAEEAPSRRARVEDAEEEAS